MMKPCILLAGVLLVYSTHAETFSFSLEQAVARALKHNPDLRLAERAIEQAELGADWAGRWENPELEVGWQGDTFGEDEGEGAVEIGFSQAFPITARLKKENAVRQSEVLLASAEVDLFRQQLTFDIVTLWIDLSTIDQTIQEEEKLLNANRSLEEFLELQISRGEASTLDLSQIQLTTARLNQAIQQQLGEQRKRLFTLKTKLGMDAEDGLHIAPLHALPTSIEHAAPALEDVLARRADYLLAAAKQGHTETLIDWHQAQRWQDVTLKLSAEREESTDEPGGLEENTLVGVSIALPLPLWQRNRSGIAQAEFEQSTAALQLEALQLKIQNELAEAELARTTAFNVARASNELIAAAEKTTEELRTAYEQGLVSFFQLQQHQTQFIELSTERWEHIADFYHADARLRFVSGNILPEKSNPTKRGEGTASP